MRRRPPKQQTISEGVFFRLAASPVLRVDCPLRGHDFGNNLKTRSPIGPVENIRAFGRCCAKPLWVRANANPPKVKAVGIPTSLNRDVGFGRTVRVMSTRFVKQMELSVRKPEQFAVIFGGKFSPTFSVFVVVTFVDSLGIVEDGEQSNNINVSTSFLRKPSPRAVAPRRDGGAILQSACRMGTTT